MRRRVLVIVGAMAACALLQGASASAATFPADGSSLGAIPDGTSITPPAPGAPRDVTFPVSGLNTTAPNAVSVTLSGTHGHMGELEAVLIAPGGAQQTIFGRTGATNVALFGDDSSLAGPYTFSDTAPAAPGWWSAAAAAPGGSPVAAGSYRASQPGGGVGATGPNTAIAPAFAGVTNPNGTWTLRVRDVAALNSGSITAASLTVTTPVPGSGTGAIPDGSGGPASYGAPLDITFPISGLTPPVTDVAVTLAGSHDYLGDLDVVLIAPDGTTQKTIFSRTGAMTGPNFGSPANIAGPYTFSDGAAASPTWWGTVGPLSSSDTVPAGTYRASEPGGAGATGANALITPAFTGLANPNGTWTLRVRDGSGTNIGSITAAGLTVTGTTPTPPDPDPPTPVTPADTTPPETTIETAKAKVKTKKKSAKVAFSIGSSESGSKFECKVDSGSFASCGASVTFKLKKGKHRIQAVAIDAAGNRDATPASVSVRVKRKR